MIDQLFDGLAVYMANYLTEIIIAAALAYGGVFGRWIFRTKESRDALHSALYTGLNLVTDKAADLVSSRVTNFSQADVAKEIAQYVRKSVPDAVKFLKVSDEHIETMALSYLKPRISQMRHMLAEEEENRMN